MIYFTGDTHFGHRNIIKFCKRPFRSIEEMDETLISNWNDEVGPNDTVYHLGDFAFKDAAEIANKLNGKIFLIQGNHDKSAKKNWNIFEKIVPYWELNINGVHIVLFHYSMRVWNRSHFNSWHLYGHSHGTLPPVGKSWDIGVDYNNFKPVSFDKLKVVMDKRPNNFNFIENRRR